MVRRILGEFPTASLRLISSRLISLSQELSHVTVRAFLLRDQFTPRAVPRLDMLTYAH